MKGKEREREKEHQLVKADNANNQVNIGKCYLLYYFFNSSVWLKFPKTISRGKLAPLQNKLEGTLYTKLLKYFLK